MYLTTWHDVAWNYCRGMSRQRVEAARALEAKNPMTLAGRRCAETHDLHIHPV
jgi:hypothetical protein